MDEPLVAILDGNLRSIIFVDPDNPPSWAEIHIPPAKEIRHNSPAAAYCPDTNAIVIVGGRNGDILRSAEKLDLSTKTWRPLPPMQQKRERTAGVCLADGFTFLVCGGADGHTVICAGAHEDIVSSCEMFDTRKNKWLSSKGLQGPLADHCMVLYRKMPLVLGGTRHDGATAGVYQYDPRLYKWTEFPFFGTPRQNFGATVLHDKIYIAGGLFGQTPLSSVEVFDGMSWSMLSSAMRSSGACKSAGCLPDKLVVLAIHTTQADVYDTETRTWMQSTALPLPAKNILLF